MKLSNLLLLLELCSISLASQCKRVYVNHVSGNEARLIVDKHNYLRKLISNGKVPGQPRGVNLKRMKYDNRLAAEAQKIANTCVFAHRKVHDNRWHAVGQNLYITYSTGQSNGSNWAGAVQGWFDEYKSYRFGKCCNSGGKMTGHYTQLVWANTEYVGCGYTYFEGPGKYRYQKLYVCNYGPAGNYVGQYPYRTGRSGCENLC